MILDTAAANNESDWGDYAATVNMCDMLDHQGRHGGSGGPATTASTR